MPHSRPIVLYRRAARTSGEWIVYFQANAANLRSIPWDDGVVFTSAERATVARSIQTFQLGESGTGSHILREADRYAVRSGDGDYPAALRLFLAEEHRHARDLGRVLDLAGIPRLAREWSDGIFRSLRHVGGLEGAICILLSAELIAKIYYAALRQATGSRVLRVLCEQILKDEAEHIRFQCERLALLRLGRRVWAERFTRALQQGFFRGVCVAFWFSHWGVLRAGGYGWQRFWRRVRQEWAWASWMMQPEELLAPNSRPPAGWGGPTLAADGPGAP